IGDLLGNEFEITVRDCSVPMDRARELVEADVEQIGSVGGFPNYFGVQRFGAVRPVTHLVGERIVRGDFEGAVRTYVCYTTEEEEADVSSVRRSLEGCEDWESAMKAMPEAMSFEKTMAGVLAKDPEDWVGALSILPYNLQMMFVHAYQSYLFNEMLSIRMDEGLPLNLPVEGDMVVPMDQNGNPDHENPVLVTSRNIDLVIRQVRSRRAYVSISLFGSDSVLAQGAMGEIENRVVESHKLEREDFEIPELPRCSSKGSRREVICPVKDLKAEFSEDSYKLSFGLPKGNYATCLLREFMKSEMRDY
ncbi:MAG: tRNA pseudouridine(13) synthase TruD, partial [Candidatus Methanomethylophilaceae archaeon]|nr:tRNA pseudouridine(13) synthase TruD [Candidatus Methanomethylophilaceae archaeon]